MSDQPPKPTTIEGVGFLLWHLQDKIAHMDARQHEDIKRLTDQIGTLASKAYVDEKLGTLRDEVNRGKPATLFANVVKFAAGVAVVVAFLGLAVKMAAALDAVSSLRPAAVSK